MFFDCSLQCFTMDVISVEEESHVIFQFQAGLVVPGPQGQNGLLPAGAVKIPVGYKMAQEFQAELAKAIEEMKPPSDLAVVTDMETARKAAEIDQKIRGSAA